MTIAIGADHRGFRLKGVLARYLGARGHIVRDLGPDTPERTDYPDFALRVARAVAGGRAARGVLICGTGIGMAMTANRIRGIRAVLANDLRLARMSRRHNNANVLCLGGDIVRADLAKRIVGVWLKTSFAGGRHRRRLARMERLVVPDAGPVTCSGKEKP